MEKDPRKNPERDRLIIGYAQRHPRASCREIGEVFDLTRQRIHQILKEEKVRERQGEGIAPGHPEIIAPRAS